MVNKNMNDPTLDAQIMEWKAFLSRHAALGTDDIAELEDHLRNHIENLQAAGLAEDEAFIIAAKRIGDLDTVSKEYASVYSGRLWKNLELTSHTTGTEIAIGKLQQEFLLIIGLAVAAAATFKIPYLAGIDYADANITFYLRNATLFCLPFLVGYFAWKRDLGLASARILIPVFIGAALFVNLYPFEREGSTEILTVIHLPIVLWFVVGITYTGDWWQSDSRRMDFVRFSGEFVIYYVLIAIGGGVLTAVTTGIFSMIGFDLELVAVEWIIPCGAIGAVLVASWLVEAKQGAVENMAPVLARVFTPLFALSLLAFVVAMLVSGNGIDIQREMLIAFDLLLAVVLGLVLYSVSSRDPGAQPGWFDTLQLVLVGMALLVDVIALSAMATRISEFGLTPNRIAALGENIVLLGSLTGYAWYYFRFLRGEDGFAALEKWQTNYIPVYAIWAAVVVILFPPLFGFV